VTLKCICIYYFTQQKYYWTTFQTILALPICSLALLIVVLCMSIYQEPYRLGRGFAVIAVGAPLYLLNIYWHKTPKYMQQIMSKPSFGVSVIFFVFVCFIIVTSELLVFIISSTAVDNFCVSYFSFYRKIVGYTRLECIFYLY